MSSKEMQQLKQCLSSLASIFEELGITSVEFKGGVATFKHDGRPLSPSLMSNLCQHVSDIYRDKLVTGEEDLPDYYFD